MSPSTRWLVFGIISAVVCVFCLVKGYKERHVETQTVDTTQYRTRYVKTLDLSQQYTLTETRIDGQTMLRIERGEIQVPLVGAIRISGSLDTDKVEVVDGILRARVKEPK